MPSPDGATIVVNSSGLLSIAVQEVAHLVALVDDVVREETGRRVGMPREHQVEEPLVVALPGVEEHEVELPVELRDLLERVAGDDA